MPDEQIKKELINTILPHLENLINNTPQYGEISIRIKISDYKAGTITHGIEHSKKIAKS